MQPIVVSNIFENLHVDIVGPLVITDCNNRYIITAIDSFSGFGHARANPEVKTKEVVEFLEEEIFTVYGVPAKIISDNGPQFISKAFKEFIDKYNVKHILTSTYHAQSNAKDERFNGTLIKTLSPYIKENQKDWDSQLLSAIYNYNTTISETRGASPYEIIYGVKPRTPLRYPNEEFYEIDAPLLKELRETVRRNIHKNLELSHQIQKYYYDRNRKKEEFYVGQPVLLRSHRVPSNICKKLAYKWIGPYIVKEIIRVDNINKSLLLTDFSSSTPIRSAFAEVRPYYFSRTEEEDEVPINVMSEHSESNEDTFTFCPDRSAQTPSNPGQVEGLQHNVSTESNELPTQSATDNPQTPETINEQISNEGNQNVEPRAPNRWANLYQISGNKR